jgi:hypothetical protein
MHGIMREQPGQKKEKGTRFRMFQLSKEMSGLGTSLANRSQNPNLLSITWSTGSCPTTHFCCLIL